MTLSSLRQHLGRLQKHIGWIALAIAVHRFVRHLLPGEVLRGATEAGGSFLQTFGGMYGIIVAFVFFVVWQQHLDTQVAIEKEAVALSELHRLLRTTSTWQGLAQAHARLVRYAHGVPLANGPTPIANPVDDHALLIETLEEYLAWQPGTPAEERLYGETLGLFHELNEAREHRITVARQRLPEGLRAFVVIGGVITVLALDFLWVDSAFVHGLFVAAMTWVVVAAISIVHDLDNPYTGDFIVDWSRFRAAAQRMEAKAEP